MLAVKGDEVKVSPLEVQAEGSGLADFDGLSAPVEELDGPGDDIIVLQHAVIEFHVQPGGGVLQDHYQGFALPAPESGEALQGVLSLFYPEGLVPEVCAAAAVGQLQVQGGKAEVPHAAGGVLLGEHVQGEGPVPACLLRDGGEAPVHVPDAVGQVAALHPGAVVGVEQDAVCARLHLVGGVFRVQGEKTVVATYHKYVLTMAMCFRGMELRQLYACFAREASAGTRQIFAAVPLEIW